MATDFGRITDALLDLIRQHGAERLTDDPDMPPYWVGIDPADDIGADVLNVAVHDAAGHMVAGYRITVERVDLD